MQRNTTIKQIFFVRNIVFAALMLLLHVARYIQTTNRGKQILQLTTCTISDSFLLSTKTDPTAVLSGIRGSKHKRYSLCSILFCKIDVILCQPTLFLWLVSFSIVSSNENYYISFHASRLQLILLVPFLPYLCQIQNNIGILHPIN